ncbi:hypothetical protein M8J75_014994 [Diaphorina citri]|nr:hypothetical protein M8J75_014994 [Diaphorina citri]
MPQDACSDCVYRGCSLCAARVALIEVSGELVGKRQCSKAPRSELFEVWSWDFYCKENGKRSMSSHLVNYEE